jgi:hypothetical protein
MSCKTFLAVGIVGLGLALSSSAHAITVNPAGEKFKFGWTDGNGDIDGICSGACEFADLNLSQKVWSITVATKSVLSFLKVTDGYVPGDTFSLKINGTATNWTSTESITKPHERTGTLTSGYFQGTLSELVLEANVAYTFALSVALTATTCTRDGQVLNPCTVGAAFAEFGALRELPPDAPPPPPPPDEEVTAVPVPAALPLLATGLGILGFGAWRRRR